MTTSYEINKLNYSSQPIKDDSLVKDDFILGLPILVTEQLSDLFYNQVVTYSEIYEFDKEEEQPKMM